MSQLLKTRKPVLEPVPAPEKLSEKNDIESPVDSDSSGDVEFKEGGYGWVVVASVLLVNAHTWGMNSSYSVFLAYYLRSGVLNGSSPLAFAFVGGLSISMALLVSPLATVCIGRFGTRTTLRLGVILEAGSFIGASFSTEMWHLLLSQGVCFGVGLGFCFTATVGVVPQWFDKRRSFANAVSTSGSGFGGLIYSLATNAMITNLGLDWAFRILAILAFVVNGACSIVLRDRNKEVGAIHVAFHLEFFKQPQFWLFVGWGFFSIIGYVIVVFSVPDYAQTVGFGATQGSVLAAIFNLSQGLGRPLIGLASDRFGRLNVAGIGTLVACLTAFFFWILAGKSYAGLVVYNLFGVFAGCIWPCVAPVGAEVVGIPLLPAVLSIYWLVLVLPSTFAEVIALALKKPGENGYLEVQIFAGLMYAASFLSIWFLRSWKLHQVNCFEMEEVEGEGERGAEDTSLRIPHSVGTYLAGIFKLKHI
ncbi:major facilitator superfamily domain-containing protein [Podospora aff. communis PSN243]|uniref:Major facilitator superfamily domain-containing protein n=1 Tax=Podospora aff. communis PSN243 TaxID=3040156 RepID=A0AAV9GY61_9PEZI|nr:major facilitator superfamily domain-containing protein [Podospora aff. communis PSN243]